MTERNDSASNEQAAIDSKPAEKPPRKIAIVGKATSSMMLAPYDDESWEIWGLSDCWRYVPRLTRSFEIHDYETGKHRWKKEYTDWLAKNQKMVWIHAPHEDLPDANIFPFAKLLEEFHPYFTNSVSWMLALAMLEGCSEIGLFGVDMAQSDPATGRNGEYEHQRPSCEYFIGLAQGMGIKVNIPPQSDLLKAQQLYAYQSHKGDRYVWHQARLQELSNRMNTLVAQERRLLRELEDTRRNISRMQGAMESDEYTLRARPGG